ncbi:hypothetical protein OF83DRAFT_1090739 [Amylostereum chailletii]|nr:hypothetical protein OF83DRAFT_1090739 [Amylostereum chailletii]
MSLAIYPNRGRSRTISPVALARQASAERAFSNPTDPEKRAFPHPPPHTPSKPSPAVPKPKHRRSHHTSQHTSQTNPAVKHHLHSVVVAVADTTAHAPIDPARATSPPVIRPPSFSHAYISPPTAPIPKYKPFPNATPARHDPTPTRRPLLPRATSPPRHQPFSASGTPSSSSPPLPAPRRRHISNFSPPALSSSPESLSRPSSSSSDDQTCLSRLRELARAQRLASAQSVFANVRARSRRERIAALVARGRQEEQEAERERERLAKEEAERARKRPVVRSGWTRVSCPTVVVGSSRPGMSVPNRAGKVRVEVVAPVDVPGRVPHTDAAANDRERFTYAFPVATCSRTASHSSRQQMQGTPKTRRALQELLEPAPNSRAVSFDEVLASMNGPLFPHSDADAALDRKQMCRARSNSGSTLQRLRDGDSAENVGGGRLEGVQRERAWAVLMASPDVPPKPRKQEKEKVALQERDCEACMAAWSRSLSSLSLSLNIPTLSLSGSTTSSAASSLSALATPPSGRSWLSNPFMRRNSALKKAQRQSAAPEPHPEVPLKHSCGRSQARCFIAVDVDDSPLGTPSTASKPSHRRSPSDAVPQPPLQPEVSSERTKRSSWIPSMAPLQSLIASAARLQQSYVTATLVTFSASDYPPSPSVSRSPSSESPNPCHKTVFWPQGVRSNDVSALLSSSSFSEENGVSEPYILQPLRELGAPVSPPPSIAGTGTGPRSYPFFLPNFASPGPRPRPVANPTHLLASALLNSRRVRMYSGAPPPPLQPNHLIPERVLSVGWDVHSPGELPVQVLGAEDGRTQSALRWGWRVVYNGEEW